MPAGEGPSAAFAEFKACGDSTKTRENMHLPTRLQKTGMRPYHRLTYIALTLRNLTARSRASRCVGARKPDKRPDRLSRIFSVGRPSNPAAAAHRGSGQDCAGASR